MVNCSQRSRIERGKRIRKEAQNLKKKKPQVWKKPTEEEILYAKDKIMDELDNPNKEEN